MSNIVLATVVLVTIFTCLVGFIAGWAKAVVTVTPPTACFLLPPRLKSWEDPGRILRQPLLQEKCSHLAAWFDGMKECDRIHRQRKGHTVWGQPQMFHSAIHHPVMRLALVKNVTGITRRRMGAWHVKQAQY